jgi:hypothetical protein
LLRDLRAAGAVQENSGVSFYRLGQGGELCSHPDQV